MLLAWLAGVRRGKAGRVQGNLMGVMAVMKGTPTTYNKDFQVCEMQHAHTASFVNAYVLVLA